MNRVTDERKALMGELHNQVIGLIDISELNPVEVTAVLRMILVNTERLFELEVKGK